MAAWRGRKDVNIALLNGQFNLSDIACFNPVNLGRSVLNTFENTFNFCCELNLIKNTRSCSNCQRDLKLSVDRRSGHSTPVVFRCTSSKCSKQYFSISDGTFFDGSKLSLEQIIVLVGVFCGGRSNSTKYEDIRYHCQIGSTRLSYETIADWLSYCREVCLEIVSRETPNLIGGAGLTVEIDESKFGKRKYNKGRLVEGQWVVGGICRETKDIFLAVCPDNKCDAATLIDIIETRVNKESTIITDCWHACDGLTEQGWNHVVVGNQYNSDGMYVWVR